MNDNRVFWRAAAMAALVGFAQGVRAFTVDGNVPAGNVIVEGVDGDTVRLRQDMRTSANWFYWGFRVAGAEGRTVRFEFTDPYAPVSCRGPAVTKDGGWTWSYAAEKDATTTSFVYTFGPDEHEVRFYQTFQYLPEQWDAFLAKHAADRDRLFKTGELCKTNKGRSVPNAVFGRLDGQHKYRFWISTRHHCGEAPATFVLEGMLEQVFADNDLGKWLRANVEIMAVPFVDYDGVVDGDQGKGRAPHDHNRDYDHQTWPETRGVIRWVKEYADNDIDVFVDMHCPWVRNRWNEHLYTVLGAEVDPDSFNQRFCRVYEKIQGGSMAYKVSDNFPYNFGWNCPANTTKGRMSGLNVKAWARQTLKKPTHIVGWEVPFANANGQVVTPESCREMGRDLMRAYKIMLENPVPQVAAPRVVGISDNGTGSVRNYIDAVEAAGHIPVVIGLTTDTNRIAKSVARIDALLLTGGEDVEPTRFGEKRSENCGMANYRRDAFDFALLAAARARQIPIAGICRGLQVINVAYGGTLYQDLPTEYKSKDGAMLLPHRWKKGLCDPAKATEHAISIVPDTRLAQAIGTEPLAANSYHHQAVKAVAPGFRVTATASDGVVEAIEAVDAPVIGVQFHPEKLIALGADEGFDRRRLMKLVALLCEQE